MLAVHGIQGVALAGGCRILLPGACVLSRRADEGSSSSHLDITSEAGSFSTAKRSIIPSILQV